jgi:hypothetical protein
VEEESPALVLTPGLEPEPELVSALVPEPMLALAPEPEHAS